MDEHVITDSRDSITREQYFDEVSSTLLSYIERSPNLELASAFARCIISVCQNLF